VLHQFKRFLGKDGLKERSFHSLRQYFISELMNNGAGAEAVRVLAGHAHSTRTTMAAARTLSRLQRRQRAAYSALASTTAPVRGTGDSSGSRTHDLAPGRRLGRHVYRA
jgi:integrase